MRVEELFRNLSYGEFSNTALGNSGNGTITEDKYPQILIYTNEGLLRLYSRFMLSEKTLLLEEVPHITNYHLKRQFAESSQSDEPWKYIKDLPGEPFEEDVIRILEVFDHRGTRRPLNDSDLSESLFTPQPDVLQIPHPKNGAPTSLSYQARHKPLLSRRTKKEGEDWSLLDQEIILPFFLEGALQAIIASKAFSHMNGQETLVKSQEHFASYEAICMDVEERDLVGMTINTTHSKLQKRGFV